MEAQQRAHRRIYRSLGFNYQGRARVWEMRQMKPRALVANNVGEALRPVTQHFPAG